jgi:caffeoyl-CoA O-methyltransferase
MLCGPQVASLLQILVRATRAKTVLEIGSFTGYGTLAIAEALPADGKVITVDKDHKTLALGIPHWEKSGHAHKIEALQGIALERILGLSQTFDLVFIDADKKAYPGYWDLAIAKTRQGGLIVVDNVLWKGGVLDPKDDKDQAMATFNERVTSDPRTQSIMLPIRDGVTIATKL